MKSVGKVWAFCDIYYLFSHVYQVNVIVRVSTNMITAARLAQILS